MKKILIILLLITTSVFSQNYDLNTGIVVNEDKDMNPGYFIGANFVIKTNQNRKYLNNLIFGFEHSAFMSNNMKYTYNTQTEQTLNDDCNCKSDNLLFGNTKDYTLKKMVRGVSINLGVEISKRWYIMTGVTNYQHISLINNEKVNEYRTMQIDAGIKYFIKSNKWYFIPTFKFNPEIISFGLGVSYY